MPIPYQSASSRFAETILRSHTSTTYAEWIDPSGGVVASTNDTSRKIIIEDGTVSIDDEAEVRRSMVFSFTVLDRDLWRRYLDPIRRYVICLYRGVRYADGSTEHVRLGQFVPVSYSYESNGDALSVRVTAHDRSRQISEFPWVDAYQVASGTTYLAAINAILADRVPQFSFRKVFPSNVTETTPDLFFSPRSSPWSAIRSIALGAGYQAFFDASGALIVTNTDTVENSTIRLDLTETSRARLSPLTVEGELADVYNGVIVRSSAPWLLFPIQGEAWDEDPASITYRYGPFGEHPYIEDSPVVASEAEATQAAQEKLASVIGVPERIAFDSLVDPRLDAGHLVQVGDAQGERSVHKIQTLTIPLIGGTMSGTVKTLRRYR
jgi:hypothetical protein